VATIVRQFALNNALPGQESFVVLLQAQNHLTVRHRTLIYSYSRESSWRSSVGANISRPILQRRYRLSFPLGSRRSHLRYVLTP
jgi:hypothetical protein